MLPITLRETFGYVRWAVWNAVIVVVALAAFSRAEAPFETLTFVFLLMIYMRVAYAIEAFDVAAADILEGVADAFLRLRITLNDVSEHEKQLFLGRQQVGWESNDRLLMKRDRSVRLFIRGVSFALLFAIGTWQLGRALLR